jgi:hypothetical protein
MTRISDIRELADCNAVTKSDLEGCRKELGCTPGEFAEHLGWPARKLQRVLDAADEDGAVPRDVVLSVVGLTHLLPENAAISRPDPPTGTEVSKHFFEASYPEVVPNECEKWTKRGASWTAEIIPDLVRELVKCALNGRLITYKDLAENIEVPSLGW